ncbi:MAG TPA: sulfite exporter TauE/SafE family protein [Ktedonosporobacter sp.]|nr:sulfite exporter TauE/SafE family protein [Ktedonosporobacter sp.]
MSIFQICVLFLSAVLGGTLNSVAGGGSFFSFPALYLTGIPPIQANTTSTVALWPGYIASVSAYRKELVKLKRVLLFILVGTSLLGGCIGAYLLLRTSQTIFVKLVPYLLLLATLLFAFSGPITARLRKRTEGSAQNEDKQITIASLIGISVLQLIISIYGGYFGGGIGIMMLAALALIGMDDIHMMNALKTLLSACINGVAVIYFIAMDAVVWPQAIVMIVGAIVGGYGGAYYARKIEQKWIRTFVIVVGLSLTIYFFVRQL